MKTHWNLWYLGKPPWDTGITPPEIVRVIEGDKIEPGRALDIGCGAGTNSLYLARHGFEVTGVDIALVGILRARWRARAARVKVHFRTADFSRLVPAELPGPFVYVQDIGCLHALDQAARTRYAEQLTARTRSGAVYMLFAFHRGSGAAPPGIEPEEIAALLADWKLVYIEEGQSGPRAAWYRLERR